MFCKEVIEKLFNRNVDRTSHRIEERGVSVFYLQTIFTREVIEYHNDINLTTEPNKNANANKDANKKTIYEIENLRDESGLIRKKGANVLCAKDGKMGAAYVDCLSGKDHVGIANVMLSYSWGNTVEDIVDVLELYCSRNNLDPKKTYVWMCCLCVNQHRVVEDMKNGQNVSFEEFRDVFRNRVREIKNVVALLSPWREPLYLRRVWCIFELFTADEFNCNLSIQMPRRETEDFKRSIYNSKSGVKINNEIYNALAGTEIEKAEASVESDRINILQIVNKEGNGSGAAELDKRVNALLREWINTNLVEYMHELDEDSMDLQRSEKSIDEVIDTYRYLGYIFYKNQQNEMALHCFSKQRVLCEANYTFFHDLTARSYNALGLVHKELGEYNEAIHYHEQSIKIKEEIYGTNHAQTATSYFNIGSAYLEKGDYDTALHFYNKCRTINETKYGFKHQNTASIYNGIGLIYHRQGKFDDAAEYYMKSLAINEEVYGKDHPKAASSYTNVGSLHYDKREYDKALEYWMMAVIIREKVLGSDHYLTIESYKNIHNVQSKMKDEMM